MRRKLRVLAVLYALVFATVVLRAASTYYVATTGTNTNCTAALNSGTPAQTMTFAWGCLTAGDTLMVANGSYGTASPPEGTSGTAGNPITVQATNDGGVTFTGGLTIQRSSYLTFIGMTVTNSGAAINISSHNSLGNSSQHLTFQRFGVGCADDTSDDACVAIGDGTHHMLWEDFWVWGGGRYSMVCYGGNGGHDTPNPGCDNNTFRRGVLRQGPNSDTGNPQATFALYYASNNIVENVISLDSQHNTTESTSDFYLTQHEASGGSNTTGFGAPVHTDSNKYYGIIIINTSGGDGCWRLDIDNSGVANSNEVHNAVCWNTPTWGLLLTNSGASASGNIIDHATVYSAGDSGYENASTSTQLNNSLLIANGGFGANQEGSGSTGAHDYNDYFGNTSGARNGVTAETHTSTTCNPAQLYPLRVEAGNCAAGAAADGSNIGATIEKRYQDGTLTGTDLWPWPNETRIRTELCGSNAGHTFGLCAGAKTLSQYIWEFAGNACPPGKCSAAPASGTPGRRMRMRMRGDLALAFWPRPLSVEP